MPASRVGSSPGFTCRCRSARLATSELRGSITISFRPRFCASRSRFHGLNGGMPPNIETTGLFPMSIATSAVSNPWLPPIQVPCREAAIAFAGWSIVTLV